MTDSARLQEYREQSFLNTMPSLRELLSSHGSILVMDAASARIQVGLVAAEETTRWACSNHEAGRGVFECVEALGIDQASIGALVFCAGPGSILGIRTTAMLVRTWNILHPRSSYSYSSLNLVAHAIKRTDVSIIADARRESWHCQTLGSPIKRVASEDLRGELIMPAGFRHWSTLPDNLAMTSYDLAQLLPTIEDADLFSINESPDAFTHSEPSYKTWTPQIHRAP